MRLLSLNDLSESCSNPGPQTVQATQDKLSQVLKSLSRIEGKNTKESRGEQQPNAAPATALTEDRILSLISEFRKKQEHELREFIKSLRTEQAGSIRQTTQKEHDSAARLVKKDTIIEKQNRGKKVEWKRETMEPSKAKAILQGQNPFPSTKYKMIRILNEHAMAPSNMREALSVSLGVEKKVIGGVYRHTNGSHWVAFLKERQQWFKEEVFAPSMHNRLSLSPNSTTHHPFFPIKISSFAHHHMCVFVRESENKGERERKTQKREQEPNP